MAHQMIKLLIGIPLLAALVVGGWYLLRVDISDMVSATGTLSPINTVLVGSQVSGTIQHLYADFNDEVKQGQLIAQIDPAIFTAKRAEAEANLKNAEATRDKAWMKSSKASSLILLNLAKASRSHCWVCSRYSTPASQRV